MSDMSREQKKRQLRSRVITPGKPQNQIPQEDREEESQQVHHKVKRRRLILLALLFILLSGLAASFYWYQRYYQYESMSIGWERQLDREGNFTAYEKFGSNLLRYSKDGASYINAEGKDVQPLRINRATIFTSVI